MHRPPLGTALLIPALLAASSAAQPSRRVAIEYRVEVDDLPLGQPTRLWIPVPADDPYQRVEGLEVEGPWAPTEQTDAAGNRLLYAEGVPEASSLGWTVRYTVTRAHRRAEPRQPAPDAPALERYLEPSARVVVDPTIRARAEAILAELGDRAEDPYAVGRAFFEHVRAHMDYDKSGDGWGRGDSRFACSVGRGNCTDFHAYFMALCLVAELPARFQIGLFGDYAPQDAPYEVSGYHCWAEFWDPARGWVPVDISEADKHPERAEDCFAQHTPNRITLSTGRDLVLTPAQHGDPLNFFVDPYLEVDGAPHPARKRVTWRDLPPR